VLTCQGLSPHCTFVPIGEIFLLKIFRRGRFWPFKIRPRLDLCYPGSVGSSVALKSTRFIWSKRSEI
jgi:hypothetical protein